VREAVFVASPSLSAALERWARDPAAPASRGAERALVKYVARMAGRATPFGLFSGVTPGALGRATALELPPLAGYRRRTRIDNDYLFALADALARDHPVQQDEVRSLLRSLRGERTLLLCTHDLPEARMLTERVAVLNRGRLVTVGATEQTLAGDALA
jgi:hypothetical protein